MSYSIGGLLSFFSKGGIMMYPLFLCSLFSVAIIIERIWAYHKAKIDVWRLLSQVRLLIEEKRFNEAVHLCEVSSGPIAAVLTTGLYYRDLSKAEVEESIQETSLYEIPRLERFLPLLGTIGNISPLLGFTGTVLGMISAFTAIANAGVSSPSIVANGIAEALLTTATGLIIAIPTLFFYNYFTHKVDTFVLEMEKCTAELINQLIHAGAIKK